MKKTQKLTIGDAATLGREIAHLDKKATAGQETLGLQLRAEYKSIEERLVNAVQSAIIEGTTTLQETVEKKQKTP